MSPLASQKTVHTWRPDVAACCMRQLQQTGDWRMETSSSSVQFACVCHAICLCPHLGQRRQQLQLLLLVRRCVGVNKRCALNQCDCPATTGPTTAQTTPATATATTTATATSTTTAATTIADKEQELKAQLAGLLHSKEYPDYLLPLKRMRSLIVSSWVFEL